jgi:hypothetical protein
MGLWDGCRSGLWVSSFDYCRQLKSADISLYKGCDFISSGSAEVRRSVAELCLLGGTRPQGSAPSKGISTIRVGEEVHP